MRSLRTRYIFFPLSILLLTLATTTGALSQSSSMPEGWKMLDLGMESGLRTGLELPSPGTELFFRDPLVGYYNPTTELNATERTTYKTIDGGIHWQATDLPVPIPFTILDNGFGTSPRGFTTTDDGATWSPILPPFPDTRLGWEITSTVAFSPLEIAVGYQARTFDETRAIFVPVGPVRLAYTLDGGTVWTFADSLVIDTITGTSTARYELHDTTLFGVMPTPPGMTEVFSRSWSQIESFQSPTQLRVIATVYGRVGTGYQTRYYLGTLDLATKRATWDLLPFREALPGESVLPQGVRFLGTSFAYAVQSRNPYTTPSYLVWSSTNGGLTWDTMSAPATVDFASFRFVNERFGASSNAITRDGGETWTSWSHPFESALFFPLDTANFYIASRNALTAHSGDAGRTWERNASGGLPRSIISHHGHVVVGRNYGSLIVTSDTGNTWRDAGLEGGLPDRTTVVWALAYADTANTGSGSVRGVASFTEYEGRTYYAMISSEDGGLTWTKGMELPMLEGAGSSIALTFASETELAPTGFLSSSKGLLVSTDRGATWTLRDTIGLRSLEMVSLTQGVGTTLDGIYSTTDAGNTWTKVHSLTATRNRPVGLNGFSAADYRALFPDRTQRSQVWDQTVTAGSAASWGSTERTAAPRPLDGYGYWLNPTTLYVVGRGATMQTSTDNGATFTLKQDSVAAFKGTSGWIVASSDAAHYYVVGAGNAAGLWSFFEKPPVSVREPRSQAASSGLKALASADGTMTLEFSLAGFAEPIVELHDMLGRQIINQQLPEVASGRHSVTLPLDGVPSGAYLISLLVDGVRSTTSVMIAR